MTTRIDQPLLLCGSLAGDTAREVMQMWGGALGDRIAAFPDGEVGYRSQWTEFLSHGVFNGHPALETVNRPPPYDSDDPDDWRGPDGDWVGLDYSKGEWKFQVKEDAQDIRFESLGYADEAIKSYAEFKRLREAGEVAAGVRFQVCMPTHESGLRWFLTRASDLERLWAPYTDVIKRDLEAICVAIPTEDLLIQWDVCSEILGYEQKGRKWFPWEPDGEPLDRYAESIAALSPLVPDETLLGVHLCYGSFTNQHLVEPEDLRCAVNMANVSVKHAGRRVDFVHMPVSVERDDDAYFAPLADLDIGDTKLYLGLLHAAGGMEGNTRRLETARRHAKYFGAATECGVGRFPREEMSTLIDFHCAVADALGS